MLELLVYLIGALVYCMVLVTAVIIVGPWIVLGRALMMSGRLLWLYLTLLAGEVRRDRDQKQPQGEEAYRQYFYGPAVRDLRQTFRGAARRIPGTVHENLRTTNTRWFRYPAASRLIAVPFGALLVVGIVLGAALCAVLLVVLCLLHAMVIMLMQGVARSFAGVLRAVDRGVLRARELHNGMLCPHCYERVPYPSYYCSREGEGQNAGCGRRHTDIRPGRYGILRRRCLCGQRLATMIMTGSYRLQAICVYCDGRMGRDTGHFPEVVVPLFGGTAAGKTQLMAAMLMTLETGGSRLAPADRTTENEYAALRYVLTSDGHPRATRRALPRAYSVLLGTRSRRRLVHLFDAAGERFTNREDTDALRYARAARTFVFVLDPLSVPAFLNGLSAAERDGIDRTLASKVEPKVVFDQAVQAVLQMGARLSNARLAVAVSKLDVLQSVGVLHDIPTDDSAMAGDWLSRELGLGNLVRSMHQEFREVRVFFTAAVALGQTEVHSSMRPLVSWCFGGLGRQVLRGG